MLYKALLLLLSLFFFSCSNSVGGDSGRPSTKEFEKDSLAGMIRVHTGESLVALGTNKTSANINERPEMMVGFEYDFSMSRSEVTCGEFNGLMESATGLSLDCEDGALPATNVSYYDAILFANERSKAEGFDTVYSYSMASFDEQRHCVKMEGFSDHADILGYRLPTEAEWVFVASRNSNVEKAWTAGNSGYKLHPVCTKAAANEFCDMFGNAMEWVNDWFGIFRDTTILNYAGAPDGGALGQRVLKGGSYRNDASSISLYGRGDVYTVVSSTRAEYVGFRLAFGVIVNPVWMGGDGMANSSRIAPMASSSFLQSRTGTRKMKLAFRNDVSGNIAFIDYTSGSLSVVEIADTIEAYHPEISPDGKRVAFCTGLEGVAGKSSLYVRDLNANGSNLVKLNVESAAIPRWRVLENGDTVIVYVTDAGNNKDASAFKAASTWQVKFAGGKFGTPEKLFDGAYHGGISEDNSIAVSGARLLRAHVADSGSTLMAHARDTVWYDSAQACNASLARDGSKRTLFLDFGKGPGVDFVGESYGTHERLLVSDSTGKLLQAVAAPAGYSFDHSEWSLGGGNFAVVTLSNLEGAHSKIALVYLKDESVVEIAEGDELWHPNFWVDAKASARPNLTLNADSAGVYYDEGVWYNALELRVKMERFWYRREEVTVVGLGSSRMMFGMYEKNVKSENFLNMAYSAGDMRGMHYLFKNYILQHVPNLKTLVIEMSPDLLWYDRSTSWGPIIDGVPGFKYDEDHSFWKDGVPEGFLSLVSECPKPESVLQHPYNLEDFLLPTMGWYGIDVFRDTTALSTLDENYKYDFSLFEEIIKMARERNLNIICFIAPQNPGYRETGSYGVYGPKRSIADSILSRVKGMGLIWMDENKMGDHDYTENMAYNMDHLSAEGAMQLTARLDSILETLK